MRGKERGVAETERITEGDVKKALVQMSDGEVATIIEIAGGWRMQARLEAMGIRPGKRVKMISHQPLRGPVALEIDNFCVALGHGMAQRIFVDSASRGTSR